VEGAAPNLHEAHRSSSGLAGAVPGAGIAMDDLGKKEPPEESKETPTDGLSGLGPYFYPAVALVLFGTIGITIGLMVGLGLVGGSSDEGGAGVPPLAFVPTPAPTMPLPTPPPTPQPAPVAAKLIVAQSIASVGAAGERPLPRRVCVFPHRPFQR